VKTLFITILLLVGICAFAYADGFWFVVDINNIVVSKADKKPDKKDLDSRNEISIKENQDIPLDQAEYRDGKIVFHVKTLEEKEAKAIADATHAEIEMVRNRAMQMACEDLEQGPFKFDYIQCSDFE